MINVIHNVLKKFGFQIKRYPDLDIRRRLKILQSEDINCIIDVGANIGQFGSSMRRYGYNKKLLSFEPLKSAFAKLEIAAKKDQKWEVYNYGLGHENSKSTINVSKNSSSSSLLKMLPVHINNAPQSKYIDTEEINIKTLDSIFDQLCDKSENILLKIDTQGYEKFVLEGANFSLKHIRIILLEMAIVPLYNKEVLFRPMIDFLDEKGFNLYSLENGFYNLKTGQLLQVDGIFVRK
jgi:FkbM family methyltransferase